jgi:hypothetical protein
MQSRRLATSSVIVGSFLLTGCLTATLPNNTAPSATEPDSAVHDSSPSRHDFERIGYIQQLYTRSGEHRLSFDDIEWLTGEAAAKAMQTDNACSGSGIETGNCSPANGFYVRNADKTPATLTLAENVAIYMQTRNPREMQQDEQISYTVFEAALNGGKRQIIDRYKQIPFWIDTDDDGYVTAIREQYVP